MVEFKRASKYDIFIKHAANGGCIVQVGCCEAAFSNTEEMLDALTDYYENTEEFEKKYNASDRNPRPVPGPGGVSGRGMGSVSSLSTRPVNEIEPIDDCCQEQCERIEYPGNN